MITAINQLFKFVLERKDIIEGVHLYDPVEVEDHHYVQGVELRMINNCPDFIIHPEEYEDVHFNPFTFKSSDRYTYLVLGHFEDFQLWVKESFEGRVARRVCQHFDFFDRSIPEQKIIEYRLEMEKVVQEMYPEAFEIMNRK